MSNGNSTQLWTRPQTQEREEVARPTIPPKVNRDVEQRTRAPESRVDTSSKSKSDRDLERESGRVGCSIDKVVVQPPAGYEASNPQADRRSYYVNGIVLERESLVKQLREIAKTRGTPVTAIINGQDCGLVDDGEGSFVASLLNGAAGVLSSRLGSAAETKAVTHLKEEIVAQVLTRGGRMHIDAHSQGSIITSNALRLLQSELPPAKWKQIVERLDVSTFGAAMHLFPKGIKVNEYAHSGDLVATSTKIASTGRQELAKAMKDILGGIDPDLDKALPSVMQETKPCVIKDDSLSAHSATNYIKDIPKFFIESYRDNRGKLELDKLASGLVRAVKNGRFSDATVRDILKDLKDEDPSGRVQGVLIEAIKSGAVGKFNLASLGLKP